MAAKMVFVNVFWGSTHKYGDSCLRLPWTRACWGKVPIVVQGPGAGPLAREAPDVESLSSFGGLMKICRTEYVWQNVLIFFI